MSVTAQAADAVTPAGDHRPVSPSAPGGPCPDSGGVPSGGGVVMRRRQQCDVEV